MGHVSAQGEARPGLRKFGVPPGGAFDQIAYHRLSSLLQAKRDALVLEVGGGEIRLSVSEGGLVAFLGLQGTSQKWGPLPSGESIWLEEGDEVRLKVAPHHARGWLACGGGLVGIRSGDRLTVGRDVIALPSAARQADILRQKENRRSSATTCLRLIAPENAPVLEGLFEVQLECDRVGIRLSGGAQRGGVELPSAPACMGLIQLPPSGQPIILGPDGPTIGGYEAIGTVIEADFAKLAQLKPFDKVQFECVEVHHAIDLLQKQTYREEKEARDLQSDRMELN